MDILKIAIFCAAGLLFAVILAITIYMRRMNRIRRMLDPRHDLLKQERKRARRAKAEAKRAHRHSRHAAAEGGGK